MPIVCRRRYAAALKEKETEQRSPRDARAGFAPGVARPCGWSLKNMSTSHHRRGGTPMDTDHKRRIAYDGVGDCRVLRCGNRRLRAGEEGRRAVLGQGQAEGRRRRPRWRRWRRRPCRRPPTSCPSSRCPPASRSRSTRAASSTRAACGAATRARSSSARCSSPARSMRSPRRTASARSRPSLSGLELPSGIEFRKGALYVATPKQIMRYDNIEDNLDKPPQPVGGLRQAAGRHPARLEVPALRAGRQALCADRRALQHLRCRRQVHADLPHQCGRQQHGGGGARRAQHGGLRLPSQDQGAVVHRQPARLAGRGLPAR